MFNEKNNVDHQEGIPDQGEKEVIRAFVNAGGSVLTWPQMNNQTVSFASIESLIQREVLWTSMSADGMRETFALNSAIFDIGSEKLESTKNSYRDKDAHQ